MTDEECKHDVFVWHSPEVYSCMRCHKAMYIQNEMGEQ